MTTKPDADMAGLREALDFIANDREVDTVGDARRIARAALAATEAPEPLPARSRTAALALHDLMRDEHGESCDCETCLAVQSLADVALAATEAPAIDRWVGPDTPRLRRVPDDPAVVPTYVLDPAGPYVLGWSPLAATEGPAGLDTEKLAAREDAIIDEYWQDAEQTNEDAALRHLAHAFALVEATARRDERP
jgi:hypothetical protein